MAGEAPPSEVLCEAMEYLCKLGTNLRSRSESLKRKRINKDKLRNCQAVRKAARKVLLICQLSKKSLENVESGVNGILNRLEQDNAIKIVPKGYLKLPKNVNLKHFKSVSVLVKSMPMSMLDKYPVRHDCKLLRWRRERAMKQNRVHSENRDVEKKSTSTELGTNSNDSDKTAHENSDSSVIRNSSDNLDIIDDKNVEQMVRQEDAGEHSPKANLEGEKSENEMSNVNTKENSKKLKENTPSDVIDSNKTNFVEGSIMKEITKKSEDKSHRRTSESEKLQSKINSRKSSDELDSPKKSKTSDEEIRASVKKSDTHVKSKEKCQKHLGCIKANKNYKKIRILDSSSSESESVKNASVIHLDSDDDGGCKKENYKAEIAQTDDKSTDNAVQGSNKSNSEEKEQQQVEDPVKPVIKCVSLSKLLKPEVVAKDKTETNNSPLICELPASNNTKPINGPNKRLVVHLDSKRHILSKELQADIIIKSKTISLKQPHSTSTLKFKRMQVLYFVPKPFDIKVCRLPKITEDFLQKYNLSRVTQNGKVVCKITEKKNKDKTLHDICLKDSLDEPCKQLSDVTNKDSPHTSAKKAKLALLDDSDGDNIPDTSAKKAKCALVDDSGGDNVPETSAKKAKCALIDDSGGDNVPHTSAKKAKCALLDDSGRDNLPHTSAKNAKCALLDDSDGDNVPDTFAKKAKCALLDDSDGDNVPKDFSETDTLTKSAQKVKEVLQGKDSNNELETNLPEDTDKVKNALLEDSDGENDTGQEIGDTIKKNISKRNKGVINESPNDADKAKSTLLNDSDLEDSEVAPKSTTSGNIEGKIPSDPISIDLNNIKSFKPAGTNTAKKALLNDSDSEKSDIVSKESSSPMKVIASEPQTDADKAKTTLLNESDVEDSEVAPNSIISVNNEGEIPSDLISNEESPKPVDTDIAKKALLNDSDSEKSDNISKDSSDPNSEKRDEKSTVELNYQSQSEKNQTSCNIVENNSKKETVIDTSNEVKEKELAKSSLLNDSSGSNSNSPSKKHCKSKSRRKSIMESMQAKKMLLTYSSSSDTEDEKLKSVMKSMKENLLKGIDSDQEEFKAGLRKKLHTPSDSDDDILSRARKRKKNSSSEDDNPNKKSKSRHRKMGRSREKPGGSSNQNSDTQDDKDIKGLTNLKTLSKSRRRRDSESDQSAKSSGQKKENKMEKMKESLIPSEGGLLDVPISSSENESSAENEIEEDLPAISLSELNGGGSITHLAKDDLLGESESDTSKEHNSDAKQEDGSDSDIKLKRRKTNAIDSDSEAGSSRKKVSGRVSDFEDSEEENSEPVKKPKRKKIVASDSDASGGDSSDETKKKRRRIKQIDSDLSESDSENEGKSKHGRKNIRKVMGKDQLEEATKKAARQEKERLARIAERQKLYNNLQFDESGKPDEVILDKVVLDFDPDTKEPLIEVDRGLVKKLKPHQANGIKFMWDACFESVKRIKKDKGSGCILAHCMGLGKTLQVVTLTHTLLTHDELTKVNRVLVVCPLSTVLNWVSEFKMWLKYAESDYEVDVYELSRFKQNSERAFQLSQWFRLGGVCVLGYEMFRNLSADNPKKYKKKMLRQFQESLVDPGPDLVVCDEGHLLKNEKTSLSQSMNRVKTLRRIVLTGTPLQNNLKEYYCMVQFVKPNLLGKYNEYLNRFVNPITNGQYTDSTEHDIRVMKRRSHVLHKMLDGAVQRRDYGVLAPFLPPKHEYVLFITLTEVQIKLYQHYLDNYSRRPLPGKSSGFLFPDFQSLQRIWTHPLVLKYNSERYEIMQQKKREREEEEDSEGSLVDFIDDDSTPDETSTEESSDDLSDTSDDSRKKSKKKKAAKKNKKENKISGRRGTRANPVEMVEENQEEPEIMEVKNDNPTEWWIPLVTDDELEDMRNSHKLVLLFEILRQCEAIGDKLLVFSQSLYSLDLIEHFLGKVDEATQEGRIDEKLLGHVGSWSPGVDYFRLDGSTSCENRSIWCRNFNREDNPRARLFLISTRAGGLGINLVAANRVVIFDVSWNPSHDVQSIFRVYRFGQKKPCYVYRFLAMGTMEEKIYERQVTKQAISKRVIDEQQIDRHYAENDLAELYKFEPRPPSPRPVPLVPKDRFFAEMLKEHEKLIYKFHEHDSLLENKEEETLSEEERKAAWEDFENEKNRPPPAPFPSWPMHNGMMPNLLAQQQQQLAYAALAQMLRKDMPNLSDDNIRNMLPIIYGANPGMFGGYDYGLLQKLTDMYKPYSQPGMMNPSMMGAMMNAGGAASGMGGGGSSGLQYEPPWQRQQQQQQQMRLQQLMQQQNQMGAKFYAGGLGSRDPVAMALQQQRAREIMLGGGGGGGGGGVGGSMVAAGAGGRPRGRPPMQPRVPVPSTAPGDVVNLDSD